MTMTYHTHLFAFVDGRYCLSVAMAEVDQVRTRKKCNQRGGSLPRSVQANNRWMIKWRVTHVLARSIDNQGGC